MFAARAAVITFEQVGIRFLNQHKVVSMALRVEYLDQPEILTLDLRLVGILVEAEDPVEVVGLLVVLDRVLGAASDYHVDEGGRIRGREIVTDADCDPMRSFSEILLEYEDADDSVKREFITIINKESERRSSSTVGESC